MDLFADKQSTSLLMVPLLVSLILLGGCSSTPTTVKSGFLGDYSQLVEATEQENARVYQRSDFKLSDIKKIKVVPFEIWLEQTTQEQNLRVNAQQLAELQQYFYQKLTKGLGKYYRLVDEADNETLIIRGAFSRLKLSKPALGVTDFIPVRIVLNAGNSAYLVATSQQDLISEVSIESEFLLGEDRSRVFAMTITRELDVTVSQEKQGNIKAVTDVLDIWVDNFIKKIAELNDKKLVQ